MTERTIERLIQSADEATVWKAYKKAEEEKMSATARQIQSATKKYNEIMELIGWDFNEIGTDCSDGTEDWNIRDMVAECDYALSTYFESGHCNAYMKESDDPYERKMWRQETEKLTRFIKHWAPYIKDMVCAENHCSKYDNARQ